MITFARFKIGIITISLLAAALVWAPVVDAAPKPPGTTGKSDLNKDGTVDNDDLVIFSLDYLGQSVETVDWCAFYQASSMEAELYGREPKFYVKHFSDLLTFISAAYCNRSDLNRDGVVNLDDVIVLSASYLERHWETIDWCQFYQDTISGNEFNGRRTRYFKQNFTLLLAFITTEFNCGGYPYLLDLENKPRRLFRITQNPNDSGDYYVTDSKIGSLFIYNEDLTLKGEIKGLSKPLGVAVDSLGYVLVGSNGSNSIEVYDPADGTQLFPFGVGLVKMPTAITIGPGIDISSGEISSDYIYVTDSRSHNVRVFDAEYNPVRTIGSPGSGPDELHFPVDTEIITQPNGDIEIFVADEVNKRIQIYDGEGIHLRTIEPSIIPHQPDPPQPDPWVDNNGDPCYKCSSMGCFPPTRPPPPPECNPVAQPIKFTRLQALSSDSIGRLHVLDVFEANTSIFELVNGTWEWTSSYGQYGEGPGFLYTPTDVLITAPGEAIVLPSDGDRIEVLDTQ